MKTTKHQNLVLMRLLSLVLLGGCTTFGKYSDIPVTPESVVITNPPIFEKTGATAYAS